MHEKVNKILHGLNDDDKQFVLARIKPLTKATASQTLCRYVAFKLIIDREEELNKNFGMMKDTLIALLSSACPSWIKKSDFGRIASLKNKNDKYIQGLLTAIVTYAAVCKVDNPHMGDACTALIESLSEIQIPPDRAEMFVCIFKSSPYNGFFFPTIQHAMQYLAAGVAPKKLQSGYNNYVKCSKDVLQVVDVDSTTALFEFDKLQEISPYVYAQLTSDLLKQKNGPKSQSALNKINYEPADFSDLLKLNNGNTLKTFWDEKKLAPAFEHIRNSLNRVKFDLSKQRVVIGEIEPFFNEILKREGPSFSYDSAVSLLLPITLFGILIERSDEIQNNKDAIALFMTKIYNAVRDTDMRPVGGFAWAARVGVKGFLAAMITVLYADYRIAEVQDNKKHAGYRSYGQKLFEGFRTIFMSAKGENIYKYKQQASIFVEELKKYPLPTMTEHAAFKKAVSDFARNIGITSLHDGQ